MRDTITRAVALLSVNELDNANIVWGADYPICGDTLKVMNRQLKERKGLQ